MEFIYLVTYYNQHDEKLSRKVIAEDVEQAKQVTIRIGRKFGEQVKSIQSVTPEMKL